MLKQVGSLRMEVFVCSILLKGWGTILSSNKQVGSVGSSVWKRSSNPTTDGDIDSNPTDPIVSS